MTTHQISDADAGTIIELVQQLPSDEFIDDVRGALPWTTIVHHNSGESRVLRGLEGVRDGLDAIQERLTSAVQHIDQWWGEAGVAPATRDRLLRCWSPPNEGNEALDGEGATTDTYRQGVQAIGGQLYPSGPVTPKLRAVLERYRGNESADAAHRLLELVARANEATNTQARSAARALGHLPPASPSSSTQRRGVIPAGLRPGGRVPPSPAPGERNGRQMPR